MVMMIMAMMIMKNQGDDAGDDAGDDDADDADGDDDDDGNADNADDDDGYHWPSYGCHMVFLWESYGIPRNSSEPPLAGTLKIYVAREIPYPDKKKTSLSILKFS